MLLRLGNQAVFHCAQNNPVPSLLPYCSCLDKVFGQPEPRQRLFLSTRIHAVSTPSACVPWMTRSSLSLILYPNVPPHGKNPEVHILAAEPNPML